MFSVGGIEVGRLPDDAVADEIDGFDVLRPAKDDLREVCVQWRVLKFHFGSVLLIRMSSEYTALIVTVWTITVSFWLFLHFSNNNFKA